MDRRFTALRVIGTIFKVLAWISLILGLLGAIGALVMAFTLSDPERLLGLNLGGPLAGIAVFVVALIIAVFSFLCLYAIGESVYLILSVEENTRRAVYIAQQQYTSYQAQYPSPAPPPIYED